MLFQKLTSSDKFELSKYATKYLAAHNGLDVKLYLGCDSQNKTNQTVYATTMVFHVETSGCHVIYQKHNLPIIKDMWTRLWKETEFSCEVALYLREHGIEISTIDLDYNSNPAKKSNKLVSAAVGYVESLGFKARCKPDLLPGAYAADSIVN